jgi:aerobic-type carbon monoxide dehydrogenase small subunit (CoxS/CutS family)
LTAFSVVTSRGQGPETTIAQVVADTVGVGYDNPSSEEIRAGLSGNICRCTGYAGIVDAVRQAAIAIRE